MTQDPVDLDDHRGAAARHAAEGRRQRQLDRQAKDLTARQKLEERERFLLAVEAENWPEVAAKAQYLIERFAETPQAKDPLREKLVAQVLHELTRLTARERTEQ